MTHGVDATNVRVVGAAGATTAILFWILGYFAPEFMASAPAGAEAAVTTLIAALAGGVLPSNALTGRGGDQDGFVHLGVLAVLVTLASLAACQNPPRSSDVIGMTAVAIETTAVAVKAACGNDVPDGPCDDGALLTTEQKQIAKRELTRAAGLLNLAISAYAISDDAAFSTYLREAENVLAALNNMLAPLGVTGG